MPSFDTSNRIIYGAMGLIAALLIGYYLGLTVESCPTTHVRAYVDNVVDSTWECIPIEVYLGESLWEIGDSLWYLPHLR